MTYDFDTTLIRRGTDCVKYDGLQHFFGVDDVIPMWVADMDFKTPDFIIDAVKKRCQHEVFGYPMPSISYISAVKHWLKHHYKITAATEELHFIPGIVAGISYVVQAFSQPGDKILVTTPVYPPFVQIPTTSQRQLNPSKLLIKDGRFCIDFDDFEAKAKESRLFILSNPHNPGGTVWSVDDLRQMAAICARYNVLVIADEIHADLTLPPASHVSFATVSEEAKQIAITFIAPSKTFNMAGLGSSVSYTANADIRKTFHSYLDNYGVANGNIFAYVAAEAAFRFGESWLEQMLQYLKGNVETTRDFLASRMPKVKPILPEASYLVWLDFADYGLTHEETGRRLLYDAKVALNDGTTFGGENYKNCYRLNIGCPRAMLLEALEKIAKAFNDVK